MSKKQHVYLFLAQLVVFFTLLLSIGVFYLASRQGNDGVTLRLFGEGDDGAFYWAQAQNVKRGLEWIRTSIYPLIIGYILRLFNTENVYLIRLFNSVGFFLLLLSSMKLIKVQYREEPIELQENYYTNSKIMTLVLFMFYLSLQMNIHISILRDIWIYFLYVQNLVIGINILFYKKKNPYYWLFWLLTLWLMGQFRAYILVAYLVSTTVFFLYRSMSKRNRIRPFIIILVVLLGIYYTFLIDFTFPIVGKSLRDALDYRMSYLVEYSGGSQMGISLSQPNYLLFLVNYIGSFLGNLIGPFPWHISSLGTLLVFFFETIPMFFVLRFLYQKLSILSNIQMFILCHGLVWIGLIAVSNDNVGTATRLRPVAWILFLLTYAVVYYKHKYMKENPEVLQ